MSRPKLPRKDLAWDANLAYAVGLIATDGCLYPDKRHISLTSSDRQLLSTFRRCLKKTNKITPTPPSKITKSKVYRIQIGDVVLYSWLEKIGITSNKSLTINELSINNLYFPDFLRGHLDGDGHIRAYKDSYNTHLNPNYVYDRIFVFFNSASKPHLTWLRSKICELINLKGSFQIKNHKNQLGKTNMYSLKFSTKEAKRLLNWIYYKPGLPCLQRKFNIARPFINHV